MRKFAVVTTVEGYKVEFVNYIAGRSVQEAESAVFDLFNMKDQVVESMRTEEIANFPHENAPVVNTMS